MAKCGRVATNGPKKMALLEEKKGKKENFWVPQSGPKVAKDSQKWPKTPKWPKQAESRQRWQRRPKMQVSNISNNGQKWPKWLKILAVTGRGDGNGPASLCIGTPPLAAENKPASPCISEGACFQPATGKRAGCPVPAWETSERGGIVSVCNPPPTGQGGGCGTPPF